MNRITKDEALPLILDALNVYNMIQWYGCEDNPAMKDMVLDEYSVDKRDLIIRKTEKYVKENLK